MDREILSRRPSVRSILEQKQRVIKRRPKGRCGETVERTALHRPFSAINTDSQKRSRTESTTPARVNASVNAKGFPSRSTKEDWDARSMR